jgi:hypothetical protein
MACEVGTKQEVSSPKQEAPVEDTSSEPMMATKAKPLCPRDNAVMRYRSTTNPAKMLGGTPDLDMDYECQWNGCSMRFNMREGYFTVVGALDHYHPVEEPGANLFQCPRHGTWLYRCENERETDERFLWRCAAEGCDYIRAGVNGIWLRE